RGLSMGLSEYLCKVPSQSLSMVHSCCLDQVWIYPFWEGQRQVLQGLVPATGASAFHQSATGGGSGRFALLGFLAWSLARCRARLSSMSQMASQSNFTAASSLGKWPRF